MDQIVSDESIDNGLHAFLRTTAISPMAMQPGGSESVSCGENGAVHFTNRIGVRVMNVNCGNDGKNGMMA